MNAWDARLKMQLWTVYPPCWDNDYDESNPVQNAIARYFYFRDEPIPPLEKEK